MDGSFLEEKDPKDLDVVCFFHFPDTVRTEEEQISLWNSHAQLFERTEVKPKYWLDAFFLPLESSPETLVSLSRYYLQLFSHQRESYLWKGMIQVPLDGASDEGAQELLQAPISSVQSGEAQL